MGADRPQKGRAVKHQHHRPSDSGVFLREAAVYQLSCADALLVFVVIGIQSGVLLSPFRVSGGRQGGPCGSVSLLLHSHFQNAAAAPLCGRKSGAGALFLLLPQGLAPPDALPGGGGRTLRQALSQSRVRQRPALPRGPCRRPAAPPVCKSRKQRPPFRTSLHESRQSPLPHGMHGAVKKRDRAAPAAKSLTQQKKPRATGLWVFLWWRQRGSNPRPLACEANALPAELCLLIKFYGFRRRHTRTAFRTASAPCPCSLDAIPALHSAQPRRRTRAASMPYPHRIPRSLGTVPVQPRCHTRTAFRTASAPCPCSLGIRPAGAALRQGVVRGKGQGAHPGARPVWWRRRDSNP